MLDTDHAAGLGIDGDGRVMIRIAHAGNKRPALWAHQHPNNPADHGSQGKDEIVHLPSLTGPLGWGQAAHGYFALIATI